MKLKELRGNKKQKEVAKDIGITASYYGMIEAEIRKPSLSVAMKLSQYFGVPVEILFSNVEKNES